MTQPGYAQSVFKDGRAMTKISLVPDSMIFDQTKLAVMPKGQGMSVSVRFMGADDHQVGLAIHEGAHAEHFMHQFRTIGIEIGKDKPPLSEQMKALGDKLSDSYVGIQFSLRYELPSDMAWSDVDELIKSKKTWSPFVRTADDPGHNLDQYIFDIASREILKNRGASGAPDLSQSALETMAFGNTDEAKQALEIINAVEDYERDLMFPNVNPFVPPRTVQYDESRKGCLR